MTADETKKFKFLSDCKSLDKASKGVALKEIRDRRLYRAEYFSFDEYVSKKLGLTPESVCEMIALGDWAQAVFPKMFAEKSDNLATETGFSTSEPQRVPCVYFISAEETARVKIGYSIDPHRRLAQLKTGSPCTLKMAGIIKNTSASLENKLHKKFSADRINGEWFHMSSEIKTFISENCK